MRKMLVRHGERSPWKHNTHRLRARCWLTLSLIWAASHAICMCFLMLRWVRPQSKAAASSLFITVVGPLSRSGGTTKKAHMAQHEDWTGPAQDRKGFAVSRRWGGRDVMLCRRRNPTTGASHRIIYFSLSSIPQCEKYLHVAPSMLRRPN